MPYIIGYGRQARETYPERSAGGTGSGALVRVGYDGVVEEFEVTPPGPYLPRNVALDPIQVTFPDFTLGNVLEVDFKLNGIVSRDEDSVAQIDTQVVVSLDGGATFYTLSPSDGTDKAQTGSTNFILLRSLDAITIVDPMPVIVSGVPGTIPVTSPPIVRVVYSFADLDTVLLLNGDPEQLTIPGAILKCSELAAASVFQGPLGQLATT